MTMVREPTVVYLNPVAMNQPRLPAETPRVHQRQTFLGTYPEMQIRQANVRHVMRPCAAVAASLPLQVQTVPLPVSSYSPPWRRPGPDVVMMPAGSLMAPAHMTIPASGHQARVAAPAEEERRRDAALVVHQQRLERHSIGLRSLQLADEERRSQEVVQSQEAANRIRELEHQLHQLRSDCETLQGRLTQAHGFEVANRGLEGDLRITQSKYDSLEIQLRKERERCQVLEGTVLNLHARAAEDQQRLRDSQAQEQALRLSGDKDLEQRARSWKDRFHQSDEEKKQLQMASAKLVEAGKEKDHLLAIANTNVQELLRQIGEERACSRQQAPKSKVEADAAEAKSRSLLLQLATMGADLQIAREKCERQNTELMRYKQGGC